MAHEQQERYSSLVLAKIRKELVLKDGVVFNNDYEGSPSAGVVQIPVRDGEVTVGDYSKSAGGSVTHGSTSYTPLVINKDKYVNEVIDGYDANSVPDNLVADRLDSASYSLATTIDTDGATVLVSGATVVNETTLDSSNIYSKIVDIRTAMSKANIPLNKRYLLVTPDSMSLVLNAPEFIDASTLSESVKQDGVIGKIAGFNIIEWNDSTANLAMIAGHPRFATRVAEFSVPLRKQNLDGSGTYIGAMAIQGRKVYAHKVLRTTAIRAVYTPGSITLAAAVGATTGTTIITVTGNAGTLKYKKNPSTRATYDLATATYGGTALTSGTTEIAVAEGDIIEVVDIVSTKVAKVGYITVTASMIKTA
jgi:hypothetical protein